MPHRRKRLLWQIFPPMVLVTLVALLGVTLVAAQYLSSFSLRQIEHDLQVRVRLVAEQLRAPLLAGDRAGLAQQVGLIGAEAEARLTVILADGQVVADSQVDPARMDNHADREEVVAALAGRPGQVTRTSKTEDRTMHYVALPVLESPGGAVVGVVRLAIPLTDMANLLRDISPRVVFGAVLVALLAALVTLSVSRRISRPLEDMQRIAERFGQHDFSRQIPLGDSQVSREVASLAEALNRMARDLSERIETITRQKNELEAVFRSMVEAVIVIDAEERIEQINLAARQLLGLVDRGIGRPMVESVRNAELQKLVREMRHSHLPLTRDLVFGDSSAERHFHASASPRFDSQGRRSGGLIVLNDVTRLRRLETMRREFVANVSHELKTPITSIKGFVETICDGAAGRPEDVERFLKIVLKQTNRLNDIVDDLLSLSRIEQEEEQGEIELQVGALRPVLENCLELSALRAREKGIRLRLDCEDGLSLAMNAHLLEQAVSNLVINAVKYSHERGEVRLRAWRQGGEVGIQVADDGCGIAREHLPRLFERFYRSDKARSRRLGGTGLGLAIAKHIVQAHGGTVGVESEVGRGSTFTIRLPGRGL